MTRPMGTDATSRRHSSRDSCLRAEPSEYMTSRMQAVELAAKGTKSSVAGTHVSLAVGVVLVSPSPIRSRILRSGAAGVGLRGADLLNHVEVVERRLAVEETGPPLECRLGLRKLGGRHRILLRGVLQQLPVVIRAIVIGGDDRQVQGA